MGYGHFVFDYCNFKKEFVYESIHVLGGRFFHPKASDLVSFWEFGSWSESAFDAFALLEFRSCGSQSRQLFYGQRSGHWNRIDLNYFLAGIGVNWYATSVGHGRLRMLISLPWSLTCWSCCSQHENCFVMIGSFSLFTGDALFCDHFLILFCLGPEIEGL